MERFKRLCVAGGVFLLVFVLLQSTTSAQAFEAAQAGSPSVWHRVTPTTSSTVSHIDRTQEASITPFLAFFMNPRSSAAEFTQQVRVHIAALHWSIAQSNIPEVLTPSLEPPAEPSIYVPTETPSVTPKASTTNVTAPLTRQNSISLERLFSGIPVLTVALLVPILVVIAVLFYSLLKTEQEGELSPGEEDSETESARAARRAHRARYRRKRHKKQ